MPKKFNTFSKVKVCCLMSLKSSALNFKCFFYSFNLQAFHGRFNWPPVLLYNYKTLFIRSRVSHLPENKLILHQQSIDNSWRQTAKITVERGTSLWESSYSSSSSLHWYSMSTIIILLCNSISRQTPCFSPILLSI